jgi:5-(carboxyamino)imidazole ribonucleotide mutase
MAKKNERTKTKKSMPKVGIIMGSSSDWPTMEHAAKVLEDDGLR